MLLRVVMHSKSPATPCRHLVCRRRSFNRSLRLFLKEVNSWAIVFSGFLFLVPGVSVWVCMCGGGGVCVRGVGLFLLTYSAIKNVCYTFTDRNI